VGEKKGRIGDRRLESKEIESEGEIQNQGYSKTQPKVASFWLPGERGAIVCGGSRSKIGAPLMQLSENLGNRRRSNKIRIGPQDRAERAEIKGIKGRFSWTMTSTKSLPRCEW
jgi:hypothetical protein